jgi:uncharacterized protein (TIGR04255 family)
VRYINQFNFAGTTVSLEQYLNTFPHVPSNLPEGLSDYGAFYMNLQMQQPDLKGMLYLSEVSSPSPSPDVVSIILDLNLSVTSPSVTMGPELWAFFDKLRERKNTYFEACISDATRELIR